ncbi:recombinase family protein [Amycolatopsis sp. cg5]|uniref:recombinase family protein n=1 Tax=Amycolatopsis sp. cg5 TaxID=3238802 RepID=UPI003525ACEF
MNSPQSFPDLQALALRLLFRQYREVSSSQRPMVYGYIRCDEPQPDYVTACADLLTWWTMAEGWRLGTIFQDVGISAETVVRPGFTGLLDAVRLPDSAAAVVVDIAHLSTCELGARRLTMAIRSTASTLHVLTDALSEVTV